VLGESAWEELVPEEVLGKLAEWEPVIVAASKRC
jgi:hypothetical protein